MYINYLLILISIVCIVRVHTICDGKITNDEYTALESLYNSTNGRHWCWDNHHPVWNFTIYNTSAPCNQNWQGIKCRCEITTYVSAIYLLKYCLNGFIPNGIGKLTRLEYMFITDSIMLSGSIPATISSMTNLKYFSLYGNNLSSTIPDSLYTLTKLEEIDLSLNILSGQLSNDISNLLSVINIHMQYNQLNGQLPSTIWNLKLLDVLVLNNNQFTGKIDLKISNNSRLTVLTLFHNYFTGEFPNEVVYFDSLTEILLGENLLTSSISTSLYNLSHLEYLAVDENYMTSIFPSTLCTLSNITSIDLSTNFFSGEICFNSGNSTLSVFEDSINSFLYGFNLQEVFLNNNSFTGTISPNICQWEYLTDIYFSFNLLSGSLPNQLGSNCLPYLQAFFINDNKINGQIPNSISELSYLREILIQNNKFTGNLINRFNHSNQVLISSIDVSSNLLTSTIPAELFQLINIQSIILTSNCFTGTLPSTVCQANNTLIALLLDGLSSNSDCINTNSLSYQFQSIMSIFYERGVYGTIPSCLFNMPLLSTLHLSGNLLSGTLPDITSYVNITVDNDIIDQITYSPTVTNISDLSLANNRLQGTIPKSFQIYNFSQQLLLSNNQFSGTLIDNFMVSPAQSALSLSVNRLSGNLPGTFLSSKSTLALDVLSGNIFECNDNNLPTNDPSYKSYSCGSKNLDLSVYIFLILLSMVLIIMIVLQVVITFKWNGKVIYCINAARSYFELITVRDLNKSVEPNESFNNPIHSSNNQTNSMISMSDITMSTIIPINTKFNYLSSYPNTLLFADSLKWFQLISLSLMVFLLVVLLPVNMILARSSSIYTYQYGWIISMVLQHGIATSTVYMIIILILLLAMKMLMYSQKIRNEQWLDDRSASTVSSEKVVEASNDVTRSRILYLCKQSALFLVLQIFNIVVTVSVQVSYVQDGLSDSNLSTIDLLCLQVSIGLFKVCWGTTFIPLSYYLLVSSGFSSLFSIQSRLFMSLINFVISPVLATLISNKSCYYYALNGQSEITSSFDLPLCQDIIKIEYSNSYFCLKLATEVLTTSFQPTFIYSYTCGSALLTAYIPVILYSYIATGLILPLLRYPMMKLQLLLMKSSISPDLPSIYLNGIAINVTLMQHLTVLLTFGLSYPVLGVVIVFAIYTESIYCQLLIGYSIKMQLLHVIENQIDRAWRVVNSCSRLVVCTVILYWGFLIFDMIGDEYGAVVGISVVISFIGLVIITVLMLTTYIINRVTFVKMSIKLLYDVTLSRYMILTSINQMDNKLGNKSFIDFISRDSKKLSMNSFGINGDNDKL